MHAYCMELKLAKQVNSKLLFFENIPPFPQNII